jgi:hypothetical protein
MARYGFAFFDSGVRFDAPEAPLLPTTMRTLSRFLENPFDDKGISLTELLAFSTDHLQRMLNNNAGGELTARITATTSALTLVEGSSTDDLTKRAIRRARKLAKDNFRKALPDNIEKVSAAVIAKFGADSPEWIECFPQRRSIFSQVTDDHLAQHLETMVNGLTAHSVALGAPVVAQGQALVDGWEAVYTPSEESTGHAAQTQGSLREARSNLQLMLFLNLLKLAELWARQPEKLAIYMQQSLLEDPPHPEPEPPTP